MISSTYLNGAMLFQIKQNPFMFHHQRQKFRSVPSEFFSIVLIKIFLAENFCLYILKTNIFFHKNKRFKVFTIIRLFFVRKQQFPLQISFLVHCFCFFPWDYLLDYKLKTSDVYSFLSFAK